MTKYVGNFGHIDSLFTAYNTVSKHFLEVIVIYYLLCCL